MPIHWADAWIIIRQTFKKTKCHWLCFFRGQWLWLSWQRGHFRHHRSAVSIQPSANSYNANLLPVNCIEKSKNKEKEAMNSRFKKFFTALVSNHGMTWLKFFLWLLTYLLPTNRSAEEGSLISWKCKWNVVGAFSSLIFVVISKTFFLLLR